MENNGYEFKNTETYELINEGDYEVILDTAEIKNTLDGSKKYISCKFLIRSDVEQTSKGRIIFDKIWQDKENPEQFDHRKLQKLLLVQGKDGKYKFSDDEDLVMFINGLSMIVHVDKKEADEYHNDAYNEIRYCSYKPSKMQPKSLETIAKDIGATFTTDNSDLPF